MGTHDGYEIPEELAPHAPGARSHTKTFAPDELRAACRSAGEGLGRHDAREARFRSAAEMVALWRGLDLPAWEAPYVLRDTRLGYLAGYEKALVSGDLPEEQTTLAARSRWGGDWRGKLPRAPARGR